MLTQATRDDEIKNYGLLRYDGELELRGASFESVRTEESGRALLRRALRCLVVGNVPGAWDAYLEPLSALEMKQVTTADVASRARLTKPPEQYEATRNSRKEAP